MAHLDSLRRDEENRQLLYLLGFAAGKNCPQDKALASFGIQFGRCFILSLLSSGRDKMSGRVRVKTPHLLPKGVGPIIYSLLKSSGRRYTDGSHAVFIRERGPTNLRHSHSLISSRRQIDGWMEISFIASGKRSVGRSL